MQSQSIRSSAQRKAANPPALGRLAAAAALGSAAILVATLAISLISINFGVLGVFLAAASSFLTVSVLSSIRRVGSFLAFSFIGLWAVGYGVASLAWLSPGNELRIQSTGLRVESIPVGLAIATIGLLAWTGGYCLFKLRIVQAAISSLRRWSTRGSANLVDYRVARLLAVYAVGLVARLALLSLGRYSYITADLEAAITQTSPITAVLGHVEFLTTVSLFLLAYVNYRDGSTTSRGLLLVVLLIELPFGLLSGMRSFILLRLLGIAVIYVLVRRRVPLSGVLILVGGVALLSPFTDAYRAEVRDGGGTSVDAAGAASLLPELLGATVTDLAPADVALAPWNFVLSRLRLVEEVAMVSQKTPSQIPYIGPSDTLFDASTVLVPRAVWPGKPVYTVGLQYARDFWDQPTSVVSSRSPGYPGEAFYRGGWIGVFVLMGLLGGTMAAVNAALGPRLHPGAIPMFVVAWSELLNLEGSLILLGAGLTQSLLITAVAMRWSSVRGPMPTERSRVLGARSDGRHPRGVGPR
jgi:hypothetical protein